MAKGVALVVAVLVVAAVTAAGACSTSRQDDPIDIADPTPDTTPTTAVSTEVPGTTPTGELAFLGPVRTVPVGDLEVGYRQFGSGPPLVMVVGQDSSMSYWGPDLPAAAGRALHRDHLRQPWRRRVDRDRSGHRQVHNR